MTKPRGVQRESRKTPATSWAGEIGDFFGQRSCCKLASKNKGNPVAKKRGNPNWGKPEVNTIPYTGTSSFEEGGQEVAPVPA